MTNRICLLAGMALLSSGAAQADATDAHAGQKGSTVVRTAALATTASSIVSEAGLKAGAVQDQQELRPDDLAQMNLQRWQLRRLNEPTEGERTHELGGNVYIYDGLTDRQVDQALDGHFGRIDYMMFVGTVKTDATGAARRDEEGKVETESGGCASE